MFLFLKTRTICFIYKGMHKDISSYNKRQISVHPKYCWCAIFIMLQDDTCGLARTEILFITILGYRMQFLANIVCNAFIHGNFNFIATFIKLQIITSY